jgi:hypothetical protein
MQFLRKQGKPYHITAEVVEGERVEKKITYIDAANKITVVLTGQTVSESKHMDSQVWSGVSDDRMLGYIELPEDKVIVEPSVKQFHGESMEQLLTKEGIAFTKEELPHIGGDKPSVYTYIHPEHGIIYIVELFTFLPPDDAMYISMIWRGAKPNDASIQAALMK